MINLATLAPRRILVCQLKQIGDVLLTTPAIRLLKKRFPQADLDVVTEQKCAPILENNPHVRKVWAVKKEASLAGQWAFYASIGREQYDLLVDFQQLPRCRFVVLMSRAPVRLSYTPPWYNRLLYTHSVQLSGGYSARHKASMLAPLGIAWDGLPLELFLTDVEKNAAQRLLAAKELTPGHFITLDPTHRHETRLWPARHYGAMIGLVHARRPDLRFFILYGPGEKDMAAQILAHCPVPQACVLPENVTGLRPLAAIQSQAALHVGNCSAPRHFAVAVGCPSLTILGASSGAWRFPSDQHQDIFTEMPCRPCNQSTCTRKDCACLENLRPETVAEKILSMLA